MRIYNRMIEDEMIYTQARLKTISLGLFSYHILIVNLSRMSIPEILKEESYSKEPYGDTNA